MIEQGITTCFGVPGESYLAVLDGFHQHADRIGFVACRQEGGAAFMADAQGKLSGRPGLCFVTRGPGATNAAIGVHTVLFVGQVAGEQRDREAFQELDYRQVFGPGTLGLAKWVGECHSADRLPEDMLTARRPLAIAAGVMPGACDQSACKIRSVRPARAAARVGPRQGQRAGSPEIGNATPTARKAALASSPFIR